MKMFFSIINFIIRKYPDVIVNVTADNYGETENVYGIHPVDYEDLDEAIADCLEFKGIPTHISLSFSGRPMAIRISFNTTTDPYFEVKCVNYEFNGHEKNRLFESEDLADGLDFLDAILSAPKKNCFYMKQEDISNALYLLDGHQKSLSRLDIITKKDGKISVDSSKDSDIPNVLARVIRNGEYFYEVKFRTHNGLEAIFVYDEQYEREASSYKELKKAFVEMATCRLGLI